MLDFLLRPLRFALAMISVAAMISGFAAVAQAQDAAAVPQQSLITVNSRLVVLDVIVVDKNGKFVSGLDGSQFHVTEDKVPQVVRNFEAPQQHEMPGGTAGTQVVGSAADLPKIGNAPVNVLVLDEVNTAFNQIAYARQMLQKYLRAQPEILPVPTLFIAAGSKKIAVLHDYTQSRAELLESVKKHTTDVDFTTMISLLNGGSTGADNGMVKTLGALTQIASSVRGIPGRKNVIWVGKGYGNSNDLKTLSTVDREKVETAVRIVTDRMLASHVTLYMIDPEGTSGHLPYGPDDSDATADSDIAGGGQGQGVEFEAFARTTGGSVITGRNDIEVAVGADAAEGSQYYTLTYRPTGNGVDAKPYRRIRVTMSDPSLRVIAREGYYTAAEVVDQVASNAAKRQPRQLQFDLVSAAKTTMIYTGIHMEAKPSTSGYTLGVKARDLTWEPQTDGTRRAEVAVLAVAYDKNDKEVGQKAAKLTEELGPNDVIRDGSVVAFKMAFPLPLRTARVRIVMRDSVSGNLGTANVKP